MAKQLRGTHECDALKVGDGATYTIWTDRHAGTIVERTERVIVLQLDKAHLTKGSTRMTDGQTYVYEIDPNGKRVKFSRRYRPDGSVDWKLVGQRARTPGGFLSPGRSERYDPHF